MWGLGRWALTLSGQRNPTDFPIYPAPLPMYQLGPGCARLSPSVPLSSRAREGDFDRRMQTRSPSLALPGRGQGEGRSAHTIRLGTLSWCTCHISSITHTIPTLSRLSHTIPHYPKDYPTQRGICGILRAGCRCWNSRAWVSHTGIWGASPNCHGHPVARLSHRVRDMWDMCVMCDFTPAAGRVRPDAPGFAAVAPARRHLPAIRRAATLPHG